AETAEILAPVRVAQPQAVAGRLQLHAAFLDALDEPVAAVEPKDRAGLEGILAGIRMGQLVAEPVDMHELVRRTHDSLDSHNARSCGLSEKVTIGVHRG